LAVVAEVNVKFSVLLTVDWTRRVWL